MKKITLCILQAGRYLILIGVLLWLPLTSYASQLVYTIQSGSFVHEADAQKQFDSLKKGLSETDLDYLRIEKVGKYFSVRIGNYNNRDSAEKYLQAMGPHLSGALLTKAYIKDERVRRIYRRLTSASRLVYTIQSGSFVREADAQKQFDSLKEGLSEKDLDHLRIEKIGKYYSVRIGNHKNRDSAEKYLKAMGPHLSAALVTKAYIKNERVKKMYKGYLSFDEPEVEERASLDVEPEKAVIPANEEPVNKAEKEMYTAASPSLDMSAVEDTPSSEIERVKAVLENEKPVNQAGIEMYSAASPLLVTPEVEEEALSDPEPEKVVVLENEKPVNQAETEMYSADHESSEDMYTKNDNEVMETDEFQFAEAADMSLDLDGLEMDDAAEEYKFPEITPEAALFAGYRFIEQGGSKKALEYEYLENHPVFGGDWRSFKHPNMMHFDLDFKNNKDYAADLRYSFKSMVHFRWFNSTLFHNLDNIELVDLDPLAGSIVDNRPAEDFGVKVAFNNIDLKLKPFDYPFHVYFKGFHRRRSGDQQQRSLQGSGYHNSTVRTTQNRDVDWRTKDFVVGSNIHLGVIETDISHRERRFDVGGDEQLVDTYTSAGFGPPCATRCAGTYPHNLIPELASTSNKIKIHTSLTGKLVAAASFTKKDGWNRDSGASTDIIHGTGAVTYRPLTNLSLFAKYSHREIDRINPSEVSMTTLDTGIKKTYTNLKPSMSSTTDAVSITAKYKPISKVTLRTKYYHKQKVRSNAEDHWMLSDDVSRKNEFTFYAGTRLIKNAEIKADYTHGWASDPLYNVEPNRSDRGSISLSWTPNYRMNFLVSYRKAQEDRSGLGYFDTEEPESRETTSDNAFASGTFHIADNLSLTTSYAYMRYKIIQDIENHDGGTDFNVPWEEKAQVYSASLNYVPVEYIRLLAEINHTESDSEYRTNLPNITLPVPLSTFSEQKIRETDYRVSGDFDCISDGSCSVEFQYSNFDDVIDNIHDDNEDGNAYIVYLKFMKRWE
jgi:hypothetical protein